MVLAVVVSVGWHTDIIVTSPLIAGTQHTCLFSYKLHYWRWTRTHTHAHQLRNLATSSVINIHSITCTPFTHWSVPTLVTPELTLTMSTQYLMVFVHMTCGQIKYSENNVASCRYLVNSCSVLYRLHTKARLTNYDVTLEVIGIFYLQCLHWINNCCKWWILKEETTEVVVKSTARILFKIQSNLVRPYSNCTMFVILDHVTLGTCSARQQT